MNGIARFERLDASVCIELEAIALSREIAAVLRPLHLSLMVPKTTHQFDWECELAVFVSRRLPAGLGR